VWGVLLLLLLLLRTDSKLSHQSCLPALARVTRCGLIASTAGLTRIHRNGSEGWCRSTRFSRVQHMPAALSFDTATPDRCSMAHMRMQQIRSIELNDAYLYSVDHKPQQAGLVESEP
jgi:hypothetical protein